MTSYVCSKCGSRCNWLPRAGGDKMIFKCVECGHSFARSPVQVLMDKNKIEL